MDAAKLTIPQIRQRLEGAEFSLEELTSLEQDSRASVIKLLQQWQKRQAKERQEMERLEAMFSYERKLKEAGCCLIAGMDEAGRGPLAGPLVVAAVILPQDCRLMMLNDSKKLSVQQRERLYDQVKEKAIAVSSIVIGIEMIDTLNIYQATIQGMYQAVRALNPQADGVLIDAVPLPDLTFPNESIIGGDARSASIAAASIIAKVERDRLMLEADLQYPEYGFAKHKGYGTPDHMAAIREYGPCPIHRRSFEPVKSLLAKEGG